MQKAQEATNVQNSDDLINARLKVKRWKVTFLPGIVVMGRNYVLYRDSSQVLDDYSYMTANGSRRINANIQSIVLVDVDEDELRDDE